MLWEGEGPTLCLDLVEDQQGVSKCTLPFSEGFGIAHGLSQEGGVLPFEDRYVILSGGKCALLKRQ